MDGPGPIDGKRNQDGLIEDHRTHKASNRGVAGPEKRQHTERPPENRRPEKNTKLGKSRQRLLLRDAKHGDDSGHGNHQTGAR